MDDFRWPVRVYYEDTDNGGVVYHANYLKFMERARTEWLRARGIEQDTLLETHGVIFAVASAQVDFLKPGRFNQQLQVSVWPAQARRASVVIEQEVCQVAEDGKESGVLCRGSVKIVCVDAVTLRPRPFPENVRREILSDR
ncbi:MAG TPA: tol-pal system-associated acyl-CoA thioesterase [Gammaproteobacteria bacterium]|nr:tol-pal system-associated acyl-CoA thioesterase [Gammaproteobacteria bacterium]